MKKKIKYKNEKGVFLPLLSVCILGIISILITFGLNTYIVRASKTELENKAISICESAINSDFFSLGSVAADLIALRTRSEFSASSIKNNNLSDIEPHFLMPSMPNSDWYNTFSNNTNSYGVKRSSFSSLGLSSCAVNKKIKDCLLYLDISSFPNDLKNEVVLNSTTSAKNTIVCSFKGSVKRFFLDPILIKTTVAYKKEVAGFYPKDYHQKPDQRELEELRGVVLAVAPQLTTNADNIKFNFSSSFPDNLKNLYDPLLDFPVYLNRKSVNFSKNKSRGASYLSQGKVKNLISPDLVSAIYNIANKNDGDDFKSIYSKKENKSDYQQVLTSCMNPLILARNAFLTTLTELLVRHSGFRSSTEVLLISSKHRGISSEITPKISNPPVKIVNFGNDLLRPDRDLNLNSNQALYQLPFIFYEKENNNKLFKNTSSYIDPFTASDSATYDSLIASQLRSCNSLYTCKEDGSGCSGGISRYTLPLLFDNRFESDDYQASLSLRPSLGSDKWDQHCPFGIGSFCSKGGGDINTKPRFGGVNAVELLSMLGSVQACPYEKYDPNIFTNSYCKKPIYNSNSVVNQSEDLQPDYLGLIRYLSGLDVSVSSPGIWKLKVKKNYSRPLDESSRPGLYQNPINKRLPLLIVTHQLPGISEAKEIAELLEINSFWQQRPITIVYMPYNPAQEVDLNGVSRFREAFKIDDLRFRNRLFIFSPLELALSLSEENYQAYWESLIFPDAHGILPNDSNIAFKALSVFNNLLKTPNKVL